MKKKIIKFTNGSTIEFGKTNNKLKGGNNLVDSLKDKPECDCCGWDDEGYQHEPQCAVLQPTEPMTDPNINNNWERSQPTEPECIWIEDNLPSQH
jgi:hypothetical protein